MKKSVTASWILVLGISAAPFFLAPSQTVRPVVIGLLDVSKTSVGTTTCDRILFAEQLPLDIVIAFIAILETRIDQCLYLLKPTSSKNLLKLPPILTNMMIRNRHKSTSSHRHSTLFNFK